MSHMLDPVYLHDVDGKRYVQAEMHDGISEHSLEQWQELWVPAMDVLRPRIADLYASGGVATQHAHWDWKDKQNDLDQLLGYQSYSVILEGRVEGMMWVNAASISHRAKLEHQKGKDLVYVEYLSVAPWNMAIKGVQTPRYKRIGSALLGMAAVLSFNEGFKGRVGLASLPQSLDFYRKMNMHVIGPDLIDPRLQYCEWSEQDAKRAVEQGAQL